MSRIKENPKSIYYTISEIKEIVAQYAFIEQLKKREIEVIYMIEPINKHVVQQTKEFNDKDLISFTK